MSIDTEEIKLYKKQFGLKIKSLREAKNMSQTELASNCHLEKTSISRIENGRTNITLKTSVVLAKALGVKLVELYNI